MSSFSFSPHGTFSPGESKIRVEVLEDASSRCIGYLKFSVGANNKWRWAETVPSDLLNTVKDIRFATKEDAADYLWSLLKMSKIFPSGNPVSEDVSQYLEQRSRSLRDEERNVLSRLLDIRIERFGLRKIAEKSNLENIVWQTDDCDKEKVVRDLLKFSPSGGDVPLISETCLYDLIGKEDARTFMSLLQKALSFVAPNVTHEMM
jgi:hypothetical protein